MQLTKTMRQVGVKKIIPAAKQQVRAASQRKVTRRALVLLALTALAATFGLSRRLPRVGAPRPRVSAADPAGSEGAALLSFRELDWKVPSQRGLICDTLRHWSWQLPSPEGVVLIRGAASDWFATGSTLDSISKYKGYGGQVIVSPDKSFHIFNPSVQLTNATRDHLDKLPSGMASLSFREFAKRIQNPGRAPPLVYPGKREELYFQAAPPAQLKIRKDVERQPISCLTEHISQAVVRPKAAPTRYSAQKLRLRVTEPGSRHMLHYDSSSTVLVQLSGAKRVQLVAHSQLPLIYPYPADHLLARRGQVNLENPDPQRFPGSEGLRPLTLFMEVGDVLMFPADTAHTTLSLSRQISLSLRLFPAK